MAEQTKKRSMTTHNETETKTEVRSKNTPPITAYLKVLDKLKTDQSLSWFGEKHLMKNIIYIMIFLVKMGFHSNSG